MTSYVMSVKASECSPRPGAAPRGATVDWIDNLEENRWRPSQSRSRSGWWPRPSSSRPPTCPGRPTPTAERHSPSSQAGRAAGDPRLEDLFLAATESSRAAYIELLDALDEKLSHLPEGPIRAKQAREAARSVLPNATETRVVVTGNYRSWRHFVAMRATEHADVEIRRLAVECLRQLQDAAPNIFGDFTITRLPDGSEVAAGAFATET